MSATPHSQAYGVFKPVGHVVMALPDGAHARDAGLELLRAGFTEDDLEAYTPAEMIQQVDADLAHAGILAGIGQELNLVKAHRELAVHGHYFIVVRTDNAHETEQAAEVARHCHASRAQHYGSLLVEELVPVGGSEHQVAESTDRGLDAQTRTGRESAGRLQ